MWQPPGCFTGASVQLISFLTETGTGVCTAMQKDPAQSQASAIAPGLPDAKNWEEGHTCLCCTSTVLEQGGPAPCPAWQGLGPELATLTEKEQKRATSDRC